MNCSSMEQFPPNLALHLRLVDFQLLRPESHFGPRELRTSKETYPLQSRLDIHGVCMKYRHPTATNKTPRITALEY